MLQTVKVYRYKNSGRLVAGLDGQFIPLNRDLTLAGKPCHRVRRDTPLDLTSYRLEVDCDHKNNTVRIVRRWDEAHLPPKSEDPKAPIESRIDISPANSFNESENRYVGKTSERNLGYPVIAISIFVMPWFIGVYGFWPPIVVFVIGVIVVALTPSNSNGDPTKIREVMEGKTRLQREAQLALDHALHSVDVWADLDGISFENAVAEVFRRQGYAVKTTPRSYDKGVDLILSRDGVTTIVQCKAYGKNVGVAPVRELQGVRASWPEAREAMLVSLYDFSRSAKDFANEHGIRLFSISRDYLKTDYRAEEDSSF